ncbi:MAG TPA: guanine deaminase [Vicinamibacterales bacterium]
MSGAQLFRATLFHTTANPFQDAGALRTHEDGGLLVRDGRIVACGSFDEAHRTDAEAALVNWRGGVVLPGFVDAHVHYPQLRIVGRLGLSLLDWLEQAALPEEARMADVVYATDTAVRFVAGLAEHGTTTALVFGAHFAAATTSLFDAAAVAGLRIISGLVVADRFVPPALRQTVDGAYRDSSELIRRFHRRGRLLYAVTPRFALSTSDAMLEMCQTLVREHGGLRVQSHINEDRHEIEKVAEAFPWARNYADVYDRFGLIGAHAVLAHNVHATDAELQRLAATRTSIAHCPASNAALGSGIFPLRRHVEAGVRVALGTDVGGGTGLGMMKEALQAYLMQRVSVDGVTLDAARMLYLSTLAGADALGLANEIGSFCPGKSADFVYLRPPAGGVLEAVIRHASRAEDVLTALFTLGGAESVREVRVEGSVAYQA